MLNSCYKVVLISGPILQRATDISVNAEISAAHPQPRVITLRTPRRRGFADAGKVQTLLALIY
jgi:hypothetical protein